MTTKNNFKAGYCNGSLGKVIGWDKNNIHILLDSGKTVIVKPYKNNSDKNVSNENLLNDYWGIRLAYAITINKAQGLTFDKLNIDLGTGTWTHGQLYSAITRGRSIENIHIEGDLYKCRIKPDQDVTEFYKLTKFAVA